MQTCIYCGKCFNPKSNRQKTCFSTKCKKILHNERIGRYRKKNKEQHRTEKIIPFIASYQWPTLSEIAEHLKIDNATVYYQIKKDMKRGRIRQIRWRYTVLEPNESQFIFYLSNLKIHIPSSHDLPYTFCNYIEDEGLVYTQDEDGTHTIKYTNLDKAIDICYRAYACIWAQLLSQKMYDQFLIRYTRKAKKEMAFFLYGFNRLSIPVLSPKNPRQWYGPAFSQILTVEHINKKITCGEDVSQYIKKIYGEIKKQLKHSHPEYDELKELLDDLLSYSDDRSLCKSIYLAFKKTINVHDEPILPIERMK